MKPLKSSKIIDLLTDRQSPLHLSEQPLMKATVCNISQGTNIQDTCIVQFTLGGLHQVIWQVCALFCNALH